MIVNAGLMWHKIAPRTLIMSTIASMGRVASLRAWRGVAQPARSFHFRHRAQTPITPRSTNFSQWYLDVISSGDLAETSPVKVRTAWCNALAV